MQPRRVCWVFVLGMLAWSQEPAAADDAAVRSELQAIYHEAAAALKNKDLQSLATHLDAGFWSRDVHGVKHTLEEARTRVQEAMEKTDAIESTRFSAIRVVTRGNMAIALATRRIAATIRDGENKPRKFVSDGIFLDLWLKSGDGWKLRRVETLAQRHTIDGKMLQPKRRSGRTATPPKTSLRPGDWEWDMSGAVPVAQWYGTPYQYGWSGSGYGYGYGFPGANFPGQIQRSQQLFLSINARNWPEQRATLQQHLMVERTKKRAKREQEAAKRQLDTEMQQYLAKQQQLQQQSN